MVDQNVISLNSFAECLHQEPQSLPCCDENGFGELCFNNFNLIDRGSVLSERRRTWQDWDPRVHDLGFGYDQFYSVSPSSTSADSMVCFEPTETELSSPPCETPYSYMYDSSPMLSIDSCVSSPVLPSKALPGAYKRLQSLDPWICTECDKWFTASHELEAHARSAMHRTYKCNKANCGRKYYRRDSYVRHMATHHSTPKNKCHICLQKSFKRKDHLLQHIRNAHPATGTCKSTPMDSHRSPGSAPIDRHLIGLENCRPPPPTAVSKRSEPQSAIETENSILALSLKLGANHPAVRFIDEKLVHMRSSLKAELAQIVSNLVYDQSYNLDSNAQQDFETISPGSISSDSA